MSISFFQQCLNSEFGIDATNVFNKSPLLKYLEKKTRSVGTSPKSRSNLNNLYAIYVLVEDYLENDYDKKGKYSKYEGAVYTNLIHRTRQLPFGSKNQNHSLNNRCNGEFRKITGLNDDPILRNLNTNRYWINEKFLLVKDGKKTRNIAQSIINIINDYVRKKKENYEEILEKCNSLVNEKNDKKTIQFIKSMLDPNVDARTFEITSFAILKNFYSLKSLSVIQGAKTKIIPLSLYKTGRTNANDGGIDFVMRPLGRFFQVTEAIDFKKFFLDIEKIMRFPITFVIKSSESKNVLLGIIRKQASQSYDKPTLEKYMNSIEEIIPIPELLKRLDTVIEKKLTKNLLQDFQTYFKLEFDVKS